MSTYHLTEAYGDLNNPRLTQSTYYDNLRFVDELQQSEIQEVMESLIWEFMDYGDSFEEAIGILETIFNDDKILCESLEYVSEARVDMQARRLQRQRQAELASQTTAEKQKTLSKYAKRDSDTAARARRAERAAAVRGALRGAKESVKGALSAAHKKVTDMRSQLAAKGSSAVLRGQAALSKVARVARGSVKGAVAGARQELQTPSKAPSSRIPGRQRTQQTRAAARQQMGDVFSDKKSPSAIKTLRAAAMASKALPPSGKSSGSTKGGRVLTASQRRMKNAALERRLNSGIDYDLLAQYMIEDIIDNGYAINEEDALIILSNFSEEYLDELMESYLID